MYKYTTDDLSLSSQVFNKMSRPFLVKVYLVIRRLKKQHHDYNHAAQKRIN